MSDSLRFIFDSVVDARVWENMMPPTTLDTLRNVDLEILTDVVRRNQRSSTFEILDWAVEPISHEAIVSTTGGLFRFYGSGKDADGVRTWSVALKILHNPEDWAQNPRDVFYWKREYEAAQAKLLTTMPDAIRAPECYRAMEHDQDAWLWTEHIVEATERRWSVADFSLVAYAAGRFGGAYLQGAPIPNHDWQCNSVFQSLLGEGTFWDSRMRPDTPDSVWKNPTVQQAFAEPLRSRVLSIIVEKKRFLDALDRLPQVFCHNDFHRRNIMIRANADEHREVVAVDWAWCGNGAIGLDAGTLLASSMFFFEFDSERLGELETVILEHYLAGVREAGWSGDERLVRLGYLLTVSLWHGIALPGWTVFMLKGNDPVDTVAMYGHSADEVLAGWVTLEAFLLDRADEARHLMRELNIP